MKSEPALILMMTTLPDVASAEALATALIEQQLAACVQLLPPITSLYRWAGAVARAEEQLLFIKTLPCQQARVTEHILATHPYALPEIVTLAIDEALPAYAAWVAQSVARV